MKMLSTLAMSIVFALALMATGFISTAQAAEGCSACTGHSEKTSAVQASMAATTTKAIETAKASIPDSLNFTLEDQDGKKHSLSDFADKIVVLEWINPECPFVVRHYKAGTMVNHANKYADKGVVWLAIDSTAHTTAADSKSWISAHNIPFAILQDRDGTVGLQYKAVTTPHMFIVAHGKLAYQGAIDDDPRGNKSEVTNYIAKALDELLASKEVSTSETKPYGCSVKYKS